MNPTWVIMPVVANMEMTRAAISDVLAQSVPVRLLIVNQGCPDDMRTELERIAEEHSERVFCWHHMPPLLSLAATWNRALDFVWETGGAEALVVNNDVRLHAGTVQILSTVQISTQALFVSCVGVTEDQFDARMNEAELWTAVTGLALNNVGIVPPENRGGPDFSCFLISAACHAHFRFDEHFTPAYCEDLDFHRRLMLAGEGARIFSVNLPYLHYGAATLKAVDEKTKVRIERGITDGSRAYYARKWGGPVNEERFWEPFQQGNPDLVRPPLEIDPAMRALDQPTTPKLQAYVQQRALAPTLTDVAALDELLADTEAPASPCEESHD
jgi:hypothetical protein